MAGGGRVSCALRLLLLLLLGSGRCLAKVEEGAMSSRDNWRFLARFCFAAGTEGRIQVTARYPAAKCGNTCQKLVFYYDDADQWRRVYGRRDQLTCSEKLDPEYMHWTQIINLDPRKPWETNLPMSEWGQQSNAFQECEYTDEYETHIRCHVGRVFSLDRPRWFYMVMSNCDPTAASSGVTLDHYSLTMTNGDDWQRHFSHDETWILETDCVMVVLFVLLLLTACLNQGKLREKNVLHPTYRLFMTALVLKLVGLVVETAAYLSYQQGRETLGVKNAGLLVHIIADVVFVTLVLLIGKGYTVTRGYISTLGKLKLSIFVTAYSGMHFVAFIWYFMLFDPAEVLYYYESIPGYCTMVLRGLALVMLTYSVAFCVKKYKEKIRFYALFYVFYALWLILLPASALIAAFVMEDWYREKLINAVEQTVGLAAYANLLYLFTPGPAKRHFPFTQPTNALSPGDGGGPDTDGDYPHEMTEHEDGGGGGTAENFTDIFKVSGTKVFQRPATEREQGTGSEHGGDDVSMVGAAAAAAEVPSPSLMAVEPRAVISVSEVAPPVHMVRSGRSLQQPEGLFEPRPLPPPVLPDFSASTTPRWMAHSHNLNRAALPPINPNKQSRE